MGDTTPTGRFAKTKYHTPHGIGKWTLFCLRTLIISNARDTNTAHVYISTVCMGKGIAVLQVVFFIILIALLSSASLSFL